MVRSLTSKFEFRSGLSIFLVAPHQTLIHPFVPATDGAYHEHQGSQQSDPRILGGQYRYTVVQPLDAFDRISLDCAVHRGGLAGINDLRMTIHKRIHFCVAIGATYIYPRDF